LADKVVEMKGTLIEELDTGIPAATTVEEKVVAPSGSKYQQMLAKAKAEKARK